MFKFNFTLEEEDIDTEIFTSIEQDPLQRESTTWNEKKSGDLPGVPVKDGRFVELSIDHLLNTLPTQISFSPLEIPLPSSGDDQKCYVSRRELFDVRFQVISEDEGASEVASDDGDPRLQFLDMPSDLVPGVYEGGFKTWECSLDLVDYLHRNLTEASLKGKRSLELGCGTAIPSLYLLQRIFSSPPSAPHIKTAIHLQDYNPAALELVTFSNVLLAWYMSPASAAFLAHQTSPEAPNPSEEEADPPEYPEPHPHSAGDLPITLALKEALVKSLEEYGVELRFFGGSWKHFGERFEAITRDSGDLERYDILLTSETIYRIESVPELIDVIWLATYPHLSINSTSGQLSELVLSESNQLHQSFILVAAKVFYFGVGGGMNDFLAAVKGRKGHDELAKQAEVKIVWEKKTGVGRKIARIIW
ncbi:hypothetical protein D9757_010230 [Collybiopsis confluens]|uniref:protein-histidine N-methyltransferase n=1 Tax=Collybiopsis confluens TaxID=2823264 RepID=A0A8H5GPM1_9AGAR|nr:hypothetical protein D9757_010230 [Collybiopsis confluens]